MASTYLFFCFNLCLYYIYIEVLKKKNSELKKPKICNVFFHLIITEIFYHQQPMIELYLKYYFTL